MDLLQVMDGAMGFPLCIWNGCKVQDGVRERTIDAFDANSESLRLTAAALQ